MRRQRVLAPSAVLLVSVAALGGLAVAVADSWLGFLLPQWVGVYGLLAVLVGLGALAGLAWEGYRHRRVA